MFSASKTAAPVSGSFQVSNSLRFRSSASAYLSRTPSSASNRQTWTWSGWVKRGALASRIFIFGPGNISSNGFYFEFNSSDQINIGEWNISAYTYDVVTTQVFRDPSAWYHLVLAFDTTQATAANRIKLYVNGVQVTSFGTTSYPSQNFNGVVNSTQGHSIGDSYANGYYFDGYMAEVNFIDGQALTPSSFGSINATTGVWQPAKYTGSYGTNGFYLKFNNGTSTTTLGYDFSGNGNNWTTNNISLTAGSTYDWMIDSPSKIQGTGYGVGNYAVLNPLSNPNGPIYTVSSANLNYSCPVSSGNALKMPVLCSIGMPTGKWYCEATETSSNSGFGVASGLVAGGSANGPQYATAYGPGGGYASAATYSGTAPTFGSGDTIGLALDAGAKTLAIYKNGALLGSFSGLESTVTSWFFIQTIWTGSDATSSVWNFGQRPFAYTPPTGYKSLCTQNLPAPAIVKGANHMAATLYTGNGASQSIANTVNGVSFQPDLVWTKARSAAISGLMYDSVRGATKYIQTNSTGAEGTGADSLTAFNANGFSAGADTSTTGVNQNGTTYVGWQWKAGGTAVTNTAGTITSSVSANTTAGFSVVTYTGTGATTTQTIGHGQSSTLSMVIIKARITGGNDNGWGVSHTSIASPNFLYLNTTDAAGNLGPAQGQPSIGTGNTFKVLAGTAPGTNNFNASGVTYVAYCFAAIAGYSAFGSYTGNGSSDGPFVYCGFLPRFVLFKNISDGTVNWWIFDSSRNTYNAVNTGLTTNLNGSESTNTAFNMDLLSNGFKLRNTNNSQNTSGSVYIYAAFASSPFQNSLAF